MASDFWVPWVFLCRAAPMPCRPILDELRYNQKDISAVMEVAREKLEQSIRCKKLEEKVLEMGMIMNEFKSTVYQAVEEEEENQKEMSRMESQKAEQLAVDPRAMEKSFSDFFKCFRKQKAAIKNYHAKEKSLKKFLESYMECMEGQCYPGA